jgi:hypothetical protein
MIQYGDKPDGPHDWKMVFIIWIIILVVSILTYPYYVEKLIILIPLGLLVLSIFYAWLRLNYSYVYNRQTNYLIATTSCCYGMQKQQAEIKLNILDIDYIKKFNNSNGFIIYKNPRIQKTSIKWKPILSHPFTYYRSKNFNNTDITKKIASFLNVYDFYAFKMASEQITAQLLHFKLPFTYRQRIWLYGMWDRKKSKHINLMLSEMSETLQIVIK